MSQTLELLAPARSADIGRTAILAGADAVYIGAPAFGARASAGNSVDDIADLCSFAHQYRAKVYVTMNTILYDNELEDARQLVYQLYASGVDALIVQDMAYLMMDLPPIALHASTQCDIRTPDKARRLAQAGFSQLVLPRELTSDEIKACADAAGVPVEVFVHGALCVSYSGDCQAGFMATGRSGNRGTCPQMCRLPYDLVDSDGRSVGPTKHYLSLCDMNRSNHIADLVSAGATSFKIEGRLKDAAYVANVTRAYSMILNRICRDSDGRYRRASYGTTTTSFTPDLNKTFNRGYTDYFMTEPGTMGAIETPKWIGQPVGKALTTCNKRERVFEISSTAGLNNGDGLGFFDVDGNYQGFRLNKVVGNKLFIATELAGLSRGTTIYRNVDKAFVDKLQTNIAACRRSVSVVITLMPVDEDRFSVEVHDERGCSATVIVDSPYQQARSDQKEHRQRTLQKTGDTIYVVESVTDNLGERFVAASVMTRARRDLLDLLDKVAQATYNFDNRRGESLAADAFAGMTLTYHDNVANKLARQFYTSHGADVKECAVEVDKPQGDIQVMQTKYCIRRELGACLTDPQARRLPSPLFLSNQSGLYRLDFDCRRCGMNVVKIR